MRCFSRKISGKKSVSKLVSVSNAVEWNQLTQVPLAVDMIKKADMKREAIHT